MVINERISTVSEGKMLAQREYKRKHDNIARNIHWELCGKLDIDRANKWYEHQPEGISRQGIIKLLRDFNIQCNHEIETQRLDIVVVN